MEIGSRQKKRIVVYVILWLALGIAAFIWLIPIGWIYSTSFKLQSKAVTSALKWIPDPFTLKNYVDVFEKSSILNWLLNSCIVAFVTTIAVLILDSLAAYGISRIKFRGRELVFWIIVAGLMVPEEVLMVPLYLSFSTVNLLNSYPPLILPRIALPLGVFILRQFFEGIPKEIEDAARIDGCSKLRIYWEIVMPLSKPALAAVAIFTFISSWNAFLWPLIVISSEKMYTVPIGIAHFEGTYGMEYTMLMAGAAIVSIPILILYLFFQKQIIQGIATTGIKG